MANPSAAESAAALRMLPSTDELLTTDVAHRLEPLAGRKRLTSIARAALASVRSDLLEAIAGSAARETVYSRESLLAAASGKLEAMWISRQSARLRRVINATGVVIHTNLGRAPLSEDAVNSIANAAGYCTLEYDLTSGKRGKRGGFLEDALAELTGAEAALVVNNCAAAAFLVLVVFARGGEVIVSRGELVEIGGDFRIPDVLTQSGATLKEIGTTNRTKLADYEKAITDSTRLVMRVHPSNYRIVGFTEKPSRAQLAELAHRKGLLLYEDAGSGAMTDLTKFGFSDEPVISESLADGADLVTFSGDKLFGASQAGIIVGRRDLVEQIRKHPLYRALRVDKLAYASLEATAESFLRGNAERELPVLRMIGLTKEELGIRTRALTQRLSERVGTNNGMSLEIVDGESVVGGGSAPDEGRPTTLLAIRHEAMSATDIEERLRKAEPPVIARIENDAVLIDLRTVRENEEDELLEVIASVLQS